MQNPNLDLDLSIFDSRFIGIDRRAKEDALLEEMQSSARNDVEDYFQFEVSRNKTLDGFGKGGLRCVIGSSFILPYTLTCVGCASVPLQRREG